MTGLTQDLRHALRALRRSSLTTTLGVVATLALGVGVTSAIFSVAYSLFLRRLPFAAPDRLVTVLNEESLGRDRVYASWSDLADFRTRTDIFETVALYHHSPQSWLSDVTQGEDRAPVSRIGVSDGFFSALGVPPLVGRLPSRDAYEMPPTTATARPVLPVVLSHRLWCARFGARADAVGQVLVLDRQRAVVVGVMPRDFSLRRGAHPEIYAPMAAVRDPALHDFAWRFWDTLARLKPGVSPAQAASAMKLFSNLRSQADPAHNRGIATRLEPLHESLFGAYRAPFPLLFCAATLLVLLTCANTASLLLSRAATREREVSLRSALGASRARIVRQLLLESGVLALAGGIAGLLVCHACLALFNRFTLVANMDLPPVELRQPAIAFAAALAAITGIVFGLAPAMHLAQADASTASTIKGSGGIFARRVSAQRLTVLLVAGEVGLSLALLVGTGLLLRSLARLDGTPLGFEPQRALTMLISNPHEDGPASSPGGYGALWPEVLSRVEALPGVQAAGLSEDFPLSNRHQDALNEPIAVPGRDLPPSGYLAVETQEVTGGYFRALGIPLMRGRTFPAGLPTAPHQSLPEVVINESFARELWPHQDPLGHTLVYGHAGREWTIVGVVGDVRQRGARQAAPRRFVYTPLRYGDFSDYDARFLVVRTTDSPAVATARVRGALRDLGRNVSMLDAQTLQQALVSYSAWDRVKAALVTTFGALALLLTLIGTYGIVARTVAARRYEICVRMALGSPAESVVHLVVRQGLRATVLGLLAGLALAWVGAQGLSSQFYGVSPFDPVVYGAAAALVCLAAAAALLAPAWRAARLDPAQALRSE